MKIRLLLALPAMAFAATSPLDPIAPFVFEALPQASQPRDAADLGMVREGLVRAHIGSGPEVSAMVTAPWFQVGQSSRLLQVRSPESPFAVVTDKRQDQLQLATAVSASLFGWGNAERDAALGIGFSREESEPRNGSVVSTNPYSRVDLSAAVQWDSWHIRSSVRNAWSPDSQATNQRLVISLGRKLPEEVQWGIQSQMPFDPDAEWTVHIAGEKTFRQALGFRAQVGTSYQKRPDSKTGELSFQRQSLTLALGTDLRFRPWQSATDPLWIRPLVEPISGQQTRWLYDCQLGVQVQWDVVASEVRPMANISRWF